MFVLDTNIVSAAAKGTPNPGVASFISSANPAELFITAITLGELAFGIEGWGTGPRRRELARWVRHELPEQFGDRVLIVDAAAAAEYATLRASLELRGRTLADNDVWIAAIAQAARFKVVTHDADFRHLDVDVIDPWA